MISLTLEQRVYKEKTLDQLLANQAELAAQLEQTTEPGGTRSIQSRLEEVEAHIGRLRDELAGNVVFDEPVADQLFMKAVKALAKKKFYLAKRYITRLETIEPFHPALSRLKEEAESGKVSRRTRSIAQGTATSYPGMDDALPAAPIATGESNGATSGMFEFSAGELETDGPQGFARFFQFHVVVSCLVVLLLACVMFGTGGVTVLQWLIEG